MRLFICLTLAGLVTGAAYAQETTACAVRAGDKKLAGAALKSFMTKCERDAKSACDVTAKEKKLSGAARTSFTTKCVKDAVGR